MPKEVVGDNLYLGRGKVYFSRKNANGTFDGEKFLGNCTTCDFTTTDDPIDKFSSATKSAPLMKHVNRRRTPEVGVEWNEYQDYNIALQAMGTVEAVSNGAGGSITNEPLNASAAVVGDRFYQLAHRKISVVVLEPLGGGTAYTIDTDYTIDANLGRIYIVKGGAADGDTVQVDYAYAAHTYQVIHGGVSSVIEGKLRFIGDPAVGSAMDVEFWSVSISPDGAMGLIGDDFAAPKFKASVLDDSANHPNDPFYKITMDHGA